VTRENLIRNLSYLAVGLGTVGTAFLISVQFIGHLRAQTGPPPGVETQPAPPTTETPPTELPPAEAQPGDSSQAPPSENSGGDEQAAESNENAPPEAVTDLEGFLEPFIYDTVNRRDPFQPYSEFEPSTETGTGQALSAAQKFELDQLKLVGIMWDVKDPRAMFLDPDKQVLVLGRDEGIGNHNGYIAAIREGEVVVVEATRRRGDLIYKTKVLRIER
jgi:type IV pilus assembly protein PilP